MVPKEHPQVFFKLLLVGYVENINSDRKIIEHASVRLDVLYFIGYDIDEPPHGIYKLLGDEIFLSVFAKCTLCVSPKGW
jgi:hypothetical protein